MPFVLDTSVAMSRAHGLISYDACYLELAMREGLPLATQDTRLREIATRVGVPLLSES
jgi:predicted nucleic acid-binding protein